MEPTRDHPLAGKIAFWAALLTVITFVVFTICFVMVYSQGTSTTWAGINAFAAQSQVGNPLFKILAQASMVLFGPLYVIILNSLNILARPDKKILSRIAADFGLAFALLSSLHYFIQVTVVRWSVASGQITGLEPFVQSNPISFILATNMLGWTLFFGLSSLFAAFVFANQGIEKVIRVALLVNGITCLVGGVGFILQNGTLVFITMNFLMGGAVLAFAIALCIHVRKNTLLFHPN